MNRVAELQHDPRFVQASWSLECLEQESPALMIESYVDTRTAASGDSLTWKLSMARSRDGWELERRFERTSVDDEWEMLEKFDDLLFRSSSELAQALPRLTQELLAATAEV